jgi:hypothetical protein
MAPLFLVCWGMMAYWLSYDNRTIDVLDGREIVTCELAAVDVAG